MKGMTVLMKKITWCVIYPPKKLHITQLLIIQKYMDVANTKSTLNLFSDPISAVFCTYPSSNYDQLFTLSPLIAKL